MDPRTQPFAGKRADDRGLTLIELLLSAMIIPIVLSAAYLAFEGTSNSLSKIEATSEATAEAQRGLDTLVREIRQAQEIKDGGGAFMIAEGTRCTFWVDVDRNGIPERVTYYVDASDLYRTEERATLPVYPYDFDTNAQAVRVMNIGTMTTTVVFTYFSNKDQPIGVSGAADPTMVSAVGIDLSASRSAQSGLVSVNFKTRVKVRALFNSLS